MMMYEMLCLWAILCAAILKVFVRDLGAEGAPASLERPGGKHQG